jgi:pimeloyl-ACP methyl ester carboxylesterase
MRRGVVLLTALALLVAAPAVAAPAPGPAGDAFYTTPPRVLPNGGHGALIWSRALTGPAVLSDAAANELLLYRSVGVGGKPVAVSGTVAVPRGTPPPGGWPVVDWGHATVGLADICAPTRSDVLGGYERPLLNRWLRAGYAVVRSDYEGLGTPGGHPDLIGTSEAHAMLDILRAAHEVEPHLNLHRVALTGHSVGGHAALWATALAPAYTPEVGIRATIAFAPASFLALQASALPTLTTPTRDLAAVAGVIVLGAQVAEPSLPVASWLSDRGTALFPLIEQQCLPELATGPFAAVAPADLFTPGANLTSLIQVLAANDPDSLSFSTPVRIEQGAADIVVPGVLTDLLVQGYVSRNQPVTYQSYPGVDHFGLVVSAADDATAYLAAKLGS